MDEQFEEELIIAIQVALNGGGIRPSWVMQHIKPVIEKYAAPRAADGRTGVIMITFDEGGLGLGLEWARCPKCKEEGTWENDVFECGACFGTFRRTPRAADGATWESLGAGFIEVEPDHSEGE